MASTTENGSLVVSFDGDDQDDRNSLTKGTIIKFVDGVWSVKNDPSFKPEGPFLAYRADLGLQCWEGGMVVDCRRRTPGVRLPELRDQLNSLIPQEQWEMDLNGDPPEAVGACLVRVPRQAQRRRTVLPHQQHDRVPDWRE